MCDRSPTLINLNRPDYRQKWGVGSTAVGMPLAEVGVLVAARNRGLLWTDDVWTQSDVGHGCCQNVKSITFRKAYHNNSGESPIRGGDCHRYQCKSVTLDIP